MDFKSLLYVYIIITTVRAVIMDHRTQCSFWKLNKFLLICFGLWPYQSKLSKNCSCLMLGIWMLSCSIPLVQSFTEETDTDIALFFESIVRLVTMTGGVALCAALRIHLDRIKILFDNIAMDWEIVTEPGEIAILRNYSRRGKTLILLYAGTFIGGAIWFLSLTYFPLLIYKDVKISYLRPFPYYSKSWIISENFYLIQLLLHEDLGMFYVMFAYIATTGMFISSVTHICGLFEIVCYRLRKLTGIKKIVKEKKTDDVDKMTNEIKIKDDDVVINELKSIIDKHKEAIRNVRVMKWLFGPTLFVVETCILLTLAMLIFDFSYNMKRSMLLTARIVSIAFMFAEFVFYLNYGGQQIIEYSNKVLTTTHFMKWYLLSNDAKKILLMIQKRSNCCNMLNAGIMTLSLENFTRIIKLSWSFACMLLSTQKKA